MAGGFREYRQPQIKQLAAEGISPPEKVSVRAKCGMIYRHGEKDSVAVMCKFLCWERALGRPS